MYFLTTRPVWVLCLLALALTFLAMSGPFIVRRYVSLDRLTTNNEVAGFKFATMGVLYAVLLAFAVILVWERFNDAESAVAAEAGRRCHPLPSRAGAGRAGYRSAPAPLGVPVRGRARRTGRTCNAGAPARQAPMHSRPCTGKSSPRTRRSRAMPPSRPSCCKQLGLLTQARRDRLVMAAGAVPGIIWLVLFTGAFLTITFTFFFGTLNVRNQAVMTGALSLLILSVLVIIVAIDRPFAGSVQISVEPLLEVLHNFQRLPGH